MRKKRTSHQEKDRHILLAVDESKSAQRALIYVADFLGGQSGFRLTILRIIPEPTDDHFDNDTERQTWMDEQYTTSETMLSNYRSILIHSGFPDDKVNTRIVSGFCRSVAERILEYQRKLNCCTVVVGRRVISRKEEFLFGSTSSKMLHTKKNCALWIIE